MQIERKLVRKYSSGGIYEKIELNHRGSVVFYDGL